ncbi:MAG TPA: VWA domain-containing protein, partial [Woeseiaceae bacterium]|nr:VWA domain-containing protein [Woeseiaceae bacterium]
IDAGVEIEAIKATHAIVARQPAPSTATVRLAGGNTIPNRDFVLDFRVAGETLKSNLLTWRDPATQQGYFTLMLYPPADTAGLERQPIEFVFVLDCSGSMNGRPIEQAKEAVTAALDRLQPTDTFQIIQFSSSASQLGATPLAATSDNLARGRRYLASLDGSGGTEMIAGIRAALEFPHDPARLRFVTFLTDGYIGNEVEILGAIHERIDVARIFSFGVGSSVNRYLMERMAKAGRGAVAYLGPDDSARRIMDGFFERVSHPALTDIRIDWGGMGVSEVYPAAIPDLFVGRAVTVTGRYSGAPGEVSVEGFTGGAPRSFPVATGSGAGDRPELAKLWARLRIADLSDRQAFEGDHYGELAAAIRTTALEHQLMSDYTAFVAVDASRRTDGNYGVTVPQALPVPDGVRYETTVGAPQDGTSQ